MDLKVLIVDDDEGVQLLLGKILEKIEGFEVSGIASDGGSALSMIEIDEPHIVFMDVEMPGLNGIECARKIMDINPKIIIIFATAHQEYMPEAFELYAFDYLVKPFRVERIKNTLERIKDTFRVQNYIADSSVKSAVDCIPNYTAKNKMSLDKVVIRNKDGISFVDMNEIILIQRENRNTVICTADEEYITSEGLSELYERLDKNLFFRSHKSYIINLSMISKIYPYGRWTFIVKFKNTCKDALITYKQYEELKSFFR
ncbi:MAG TPA: response regulator transcription factor [Clostridiaceae bacterium]|nr:response regulator transcription factor [Clostridiaceae bacterium]